MKKVYRGTGLLALTVIVLLSAIIVAWPAREQGLLERATRVADVKGWWPHEGYIADPPYQWLSDARLFSHSGWWRLQNPFVFDVKTHQRTLLAALEKRVNDGHDGTEQWELSPDGNWVLWTLEFEDDVRAARLDGSHYRVWPMASASDIDWLDDSRHWVARDFDRERNIATRAILGDVSSPAYAVPVSLAEADWWLNVGIHEAETAVKIDLTGGVVAERCLKSAQPSRTIVLHAPAGTRIQKIVSDADGHRLAWLLDATRTPPLFALLHRWMPVIGQGTRHRMELWVSRPDGTALREIGYVSTKPDADADEVPTFLQWLPDGKRLSFVYKDALWTVPVDR